MKKKSIDIEEQQLYKILYPKASSYVDSLKEKDISSAFINGKGFLPSLSTNTDEQNSSFRVSLSSTTKTPFQEPSSSYCSLDLYQQIEVNIPLQLDKISVTDPNCIQSDGSTGIKRRYDSLTDDETYKQSSSFLQKRQKKQ